MEPEAANPYESPRTSSEPQLSRHERQILETYLQFRTQPPTVLSLLPKALLYWLVVGGILITLTMLIYLLSEAIGQAQLTLFSVFLGGIVLGLVCGALSRDIHYVRRIVKNAPIMLRIIDWQRLERACYLHSGSPD